MLHSIDAGGSIWRAVGTSPPAAVGNTGGLDVVQGPFPTSLAIQPGERIALQPIDDGNTPIVVGTAGFDGIRYFTGVLPDGSSSMLAPGATMDSGQIVPIQAMVSFTPPPPPPPPSARTLTVTTSGSGTGTISSAGIDCGGAAHHVCSTAYPDGTKVTLTATPSGASRFGGFTGLSGDDPLHRHPERDQDRRWQVRRDPARAQAQAGVPGLLAGTACDSGRTGAADGLAGQREKQMGDGDSLPPE